MMTMIDEIILLLQDSYQSHKDTLEMMLK